jgi:hypothetical protein|tara:strand:- start:2414 stop:3424 length:1011 start_codon:yes stop_codon:yes gene_type:complete
MDRLLELTVKPLEPSKFTLHNIFKDKVHKFKSKTSIRNYLRTEFQIKDKSLTDLLEELLKYNFVLKSNEMECVKSYLGFKPPIIHTTLTDQQFREKLTTSKHNDIMENLTENTSWVSKDDYEYNITQNASDLTEINTKLEGILTTLKVLKDESIQCQKDRLEYKRDKENLNQKIEKLNEKTYISILNSASDIKSVKDDLISFNNKFNNLSTIQESIIGDIEPIYLPQKIDKKPLEPIDDKSTSSNHSNLTKMLNDKLVDKDLIIDDSSDEISKNNIKNLYAGSVFEVETGIDTYSTDLKEAYQLSYNERKIRKRKKHNNLTRKLTILFKKNHSLIK